MTQNDLKLRSPMDSSKLAENYSTATTCQQWQKTDLQRMHLTNIHDDVKVLKQTHETFDRSGMMEKY